MTRAQNLSFSGMERTEEETCVTDALRDNDYPSGFIQKHTITSRRREEVEVEKPKTTLTLPYIRGLSEAIRRVLTSWGQGSVWTSMDSPPDAGTPKGPSPKRRTQRNCVLHPLCGVLKCVHRPDWEEPQAARQWTLLCTEECMGTSKHPPRQSMCSRLDMQWTSAGLRCWTITSTPPHAACWRAGTSSTTRQSWTGSKETYQKCMWRSRTDGHVSTYHLVFFFIFYNFTYL